MDNTSGFTRSQHGHTPKSLLTLAEYLELALDEGECVVLMRHSAGVCTVYIGDPTGSEDELTRHGSIPAAVADEIIELTQAGANRITTGDQMYRFIRRLTNIADGGAVIFTPT